MNNQLNSVENSRIKRINNQIIYIILSSIVVVAIFIMCAVLIVYASEKKLSKRMVEYYSNNDNYQLCRGTIVEIYDNGCKVSDILSIDEKEIPLNKPYYMKIFSKNIVQTMTIFNPTIGMEFDFKACFGFYGEIHFFPVVQLIVDGYEILKYDEGKEALIEWASSFK